MRFYQFFRFPAFLLDAGFKQEASLGSVAAAERSSLISVSPYFFSALASWTVVSQDKPTS